jgi:hypothetical protein
VPGAIFTFDADDSARLVITASPQIDRANDSTPPFPATRYWIEDAGLIALNGPDLVAGATPSGRDAAGFNVASVDYWGSRFDSGSGLVTNPGAWFTGVDGAAVPSLTRFAALQITAASVGAAFNAGDGGWIFSGGVGVDTYFGLHCRTDGATPKIGVQVRDSAPSFKSVEVPFTLSAWIVVVIRYGGGLLELSIDGGATWTVVAVTGSIAAGPGNHYIGANHFSGRSFTGQMAYLADYATALSDAEVLQEAAYIDGLVNG